MSRERIQCILLQNGLQFVVKWCAIYRAYKGIGQHACLQDGQGEGTYYLHNHLRFVVLFNLNSETGLSRIVGFEVEPFSVKHQVEGPLSNDPPPQLLTCAPSSMRFVKHEDEPQVIAEGEDVIFTYDIIWLVRFPYQL